MLPATKSDRPSLADVFPSCFGAVAASSNTLGLAPVDSAIVVLVDGLGAVPLAERAGHARTLSERLSKASTMSAGFPTTTASSLATLTTGTAPGEHGLVGYSVLDSDNDRVVNQLTGWDADLDPATWQRSPTMFERASEFDASAFVVAPEKFRSSGFTRAVLRGADYRSGASIEDRFDEALAISAAVERSVVYLYIAELDAVGHARGSASDAWIATLERIDAAVRDADSRLGRQTGMLVTADHGVIDTPEHAHILFDESSELVDAIRWVAGEPRCLQLHFDPEASDAERERTIAAWREHESARSWVLTRDEAVAAGWFGARVDPEVLPRIGDLIVAARKNVAYYDSRPKNQSARGMIGQHGSLSRDETAIPLLRFGAFAAA
ncbi:alkaline phosphatase family protein [Marisediminicola sp. LYQ85]|uniref:alkaline phosphatase family protein n=1 Tax=Marisediminicola sp. LYQ85 TaxID=3391062 RepID=UPI0039835619